MRRSGPPSPVSLSAGAIRRGGESGGGGRYAVYRATQMSGMWRVVGLNEQRKKQPGCKQAQGRDRRMVCVQQSPYNGPLVLRWIRSLHKRASRARAHAGRGNSKGTWTRRRAHVHSVREGERERE
eukprot:scaffold25466_cov34-Tisochrysis_lutea.AAC.6